MLTTIKNFTTDLINSSHDIKLEDAAIYNNKKLSVTISKKGYMASFEIVSSLEYDFLAINSGDETIVFNDSKKFDTVKELCSKIKEDYNAFSTLKYSV